MLEALPAPASEFSTSSHLKGQRLYRTWSSSASSENWTICRQAQVMNVTETFQSLHIS